MPFGGGEEGEQGVARGEEAWKGIQNHHRAKFLSEDGSTNLNYVSPQRTPALQSDKGGGNTQEKSKSLPLPPL